MTLVLPEEGAGHVIVASVSGGKDSTALLLALREAELPYRAVFADTGWEASETYEYLELLERRLGPIDRVRCESGGMVPEIRLRVGFARRMQRWCTRKLKLEPIRAYHDALGAETVNAMGIRAAESKKRAQMSEWEDDDEWGGYVWRPLLRWTIEDVLGIHRRHDIPVNPLYHAGFDRVGCYPCIFSRKEELRLLAERSPERITLIRDLEVEITAARAREPERFGEPRSTYFQTRERTDNGPVGIDDVISWARTDRGGRQLPLVPDPPRGGCMKWGLCETGPDEEDEHAGA